MRANYDDDDTRVVNQRGPSGAVVLFRQPAQSAPPPEPSRPLISAPVRRMLGALAFVALMAPVTLALAWFAFGCFGPHQ